MANYATSALKLSDTYVNTLPYSTCSTAAATAAKTVAAGTFSLETGAMVVVKFTVTNTAANPTLNVSSTGAKAIYYNGAAITAGYLKANKIYQFIYNGTQWDLVGDVDTNTTYTSLKNPNALTIKAGSDTVSSYDGSAAKTFTVAASSTAGAFTLSDGSTTKTVQLAGKFTDTDTKVTAVGNHYAPSADSSAALSVDASSSTAATWNSTSLVTGVNLQRDAKGHVTGVTVDSIKMPANPDTNTAHGHSAGVGLTGSGAAGASGTYTYKVNLVDETKSANAATYTAGGTSKFYAVQLDANDKLGVYVPWTGDISKVTAGDGLTGGASSGTATLHVGAGVGITVDADAVNVAFGDSATAVGSTASGGSAATASRSDHTHSLSKSAVTTALGYTPPTSDTNTTYTIATGDSNGKIKVTPSSGSAYNVSVKGLGSAAYTASTAYATAAQGTKADNALPKSGGSLTGTVMQTVAGNPYFGMNDGSTNWYLQAVQEEGKVGLGPTWNNATKWDASGNMSVPGGLSASSGTITGPVKINGAEVADGSGQLAMLKALSTSKAAGAGNNWVGRTMIGAKDLTFLMGTYNGLAGIGAHSWTDAAAGTGAAWAPMYFNPDGNSPMYFGANGTGWTANQGTLKVQGSTTAGSGTVEVNGTLKVNGTAVAVNGHKHSASDITSGTLPISRGGTNATSAAAARTNLDVYSTSEVDAKIANSGMNYTYGTEDLEAGVTELETGKLHFVYE